MNNNLTDIYNRLVFKQKVIKLIELIEQGNYQFTGELYGLIQELKSELTSGTGTWV